MSTADKGKEVKKGRLILAAAVLLLSGCANSAVTPSDGPVPPNRIPDLSVVAPEPTSTPSAAASSQPATSPAAPVGQQKSFYNAPGQEYSVYQELINSGQAETAALIKQIVDQPIAVWLGDWDGVEGAARKASEIAQAARNANEIPLFVLYAIPGRDCGLYSAGGLPEEQYLTFVSAVAAGIAESNAWVILEPDALAQMGDCDGQGDRARLLGGAAELLAQAGAKVFLDAGHSGWRSVADTVARLEQVGTSNLTGFATNTSNFNATAQEVAWAEQIHAATGLSFVVDTSRNGNGSNGEWCNPRGRALGEAPAVLADSGFVARVWAKVPGESDGSCNGGPPAGHWWMEYAVEMVRNAGG